MRYSAFIPLALMLGLFACSKAEQQKTTADVRDAAHEVGDQAKEAAHSPEVKKAGAEIKSAAKDAATVAKGALKGAAEGAREGAAKAEGKDAADRADDDRK